MQSKSSPNYQWPVFHPLQYGNLDILSVQTGDSPSQNSTQLYYYFICLTICRHLAKSGHPLDNTITDLAKLPQPCNTIVQQLSKLSLEALNNNKLIFALEAMRAACPGINGTLAWTALSISTFWYHWESNDI